MDRLEAMSMVLAVAEAGSLSAAARQQKAPLATVSRKVSELEAHLQTKLFNRSSRALVPTDAGRSYIAAAKRILADVAEAERAASGEYTTPRGELIVSAPFALGRLYLQPVLTEFLATFPRCRCSSHLSGSGGQSSGRARGRWASIGNSRRQQPDRGADRRNHPRGCASPAYLKSRGTPRSPDDLSRARLHHLSTDPVANHCGGSNATRPNMPCRCDPGSL